MNHVTAYRLSWRLSESKPLRSACWWPRGLGVIAVASVIAALTLAPLPAHAQDEAATEATPAEDAASSKEIAPGVTEEDIKDKNFDSNFADLLKLLGKRALTRTRRAFALGPFIGAAPGLAFRDGVSTDFTLQAGLALHHYNVPILPSTARLKEIIMGLLKKIAIEKVKALITAGLAPTDEAIQNIINETWEELKALFTLKYLPKRFEQPTVMGAIEAAYMFVSNEFSLRVRAGFPVKSFYFSFGLAGQFNDGFEASIPVELSKPMFLSDSPRSPTVHFFLRGEIAAVGRDDLPDRLFLGARFVLDVI